MLSNMSDLFEFSHGHPEFSPEEAMLRMVQNYQIGGPNNSSQAAHAQYMMMGMAPTSIQQGQLSNGGRTPAMVGGPGMTNMAMIGRNQEHLGAFASPTMSNLGLPGGSAMNGSPHLSTGAGPVHTPSPAQGHMQPPALIGQQNSQGGASGITQSSTTSPNITSKRRRASAIKTEGDDGTDSTAVGGEPNGVGGAGTGAKVKASPRTGVSAKRVKSSAA